jgi:K+-sensing histidine kinase KdpD
METDTETEQDALATTQATAEAVVDAIAQARAQRDELMVLASHDMKNAIGVLDSALTMIEEMPEGAASMQGMMRRATHRLGIVVRAMIDVDLLQRNVMPITPTAVRFAAIVTPVVEAALAVAATKTLEIVPAGELDARLSCDAGLVERMVAALLEHALANAPNGSRVDVDGRRSAGDRFCIRVAHHGRAVTTAALDKYFTTLPLRFCRLAAIRHGGTLRAVSPVADEAGLAFEIDLPA